MGWLETLTLGDFRIAVLCGGKGSEREVSLVSGRAVAQAFAGLNLPCDLFELTENQLPPELKQETHLVLPVVHGAYGEDGQLSAQLDAGGYAYAGCGQSASVLCFDKLACKAIASRLGLPVATDFLLEKTAVHSFKEIASSLGEVFILKPRWDGSSVGLYLIRDEEEFSAAATDLSRTDYLAEAFIEGYDLTVGILGNEALGVVAVHPAGGLYDYQHKYTAGLSQYEAPADIPKTLADDLRDWSLEIYRACGCRDLARVDFRIGPDNEVAFLEVNTLPGMTPTSLLPKSAGCRALSFDQLVLQWASFALERATGLN